MNSLRGKDYRSLTRSLMNTPVESARSAKPDEMLVVY
jgi:hypothetical protein